MYKKILLIIAATFSLALACTTQADCPDSSLCIRNSYCLTPEQLKYLAETYAPIESVAKVATQPQQCKLAYDCDEPYDRCSKGTCMSDERADLYRQAVSKAFTDNFGRVEVKSETIKCVSNVQCVAGDICYQGKCQGYQGAMVEI